MDDDDDGDNYDHGDDGGGGGVVRYFNQWSSDLVWISTSALFDGKLFLN